MRYARSLVVLSALLLSRCAPAPDVAPIVADVGFERLNLVIVNRDARPWSDVVFSIEPGGYSADAPTIAAGERFSIASGLLANQAGERFNPMTHKPVMFRLVATVEGQTLTWSTPFRYDR